MNTYLLVDESSLNFSERLNALIELRKEFKRLKTAVNNLAISYSTQRETTNKVLDNRTKFRKSIRNFITTRNSETRNKSIAELDFISNRVSNKIKFELLSKIILNLIVFIEFLIKVELKDRHRQDTRFKKKNDN
jgi:hypothetical protein